MKTNNNNTRNENKNGMAAVINYAAELLNDGATVTSFEKFGYQFREIRTASGYVCLCASDFAKAAAIAAGLEDNNSEPATMSEQAEPTQGRARRALAVIADYVAGTWDSIKTRSRKAWNRTKKAAARVALVSFRVLWFAGILAACGFTLGFVASQLADVLPAGLHWFPRMLVGLVALFGSTLGVELVLLMITRRIDRATNNRLFAMH